MRNNPTVTTGTHGRAHSGREVHSPNDARAELHTRVMTHVHSARAWRRGAAAQYVVLAAAAGRRLAGIDVMTASLPAHRTARAARAGASPEAAVAAAAAEFLADFVPSLTAREWAAVRGAGAAATAAAAGGDAAAAAAAAELRVFFGVWTLKEAYIKAG